MAIVFPQCCKVSFFKVLTLLITPRVEVQERKGGAIRKVIVQKEQVELKTIDFSLSLHKSSKLNTCSPFLSLLSRCFIAFEACLSVFVGYCIACLPAWNLFTKENRSRPSSQLSAGQIFSKIRVLAKSRNQCKFIQVLLQSMVKFTWYFSTFPSILHALSSERKFLLSLKL